MVRFTELLFLHKEFSCLHEVGKSCQVDGQVAVIHFQTAV